MKSYTIIVDAAMDVFKTKCSMFDATRMKGYNRSAFASSSSFGVQFKNVDFMTKFALVIHQNDYNKSDVLVEIFHMAEGDSWHDKKKKVVPLSYDVLKKLVIGTSYEYAIVNREGRGFIYGLRCDGLWLRPSYEMCHNTNAWDFFRVYGSALAAALKYPDVIHDLNEGMEFNEKIHDIINFDNEMKGSGLYACGIENSRKRIDDLLKELEDEDKEISSNHRTFAEAVETLRQYGITYKKRKVA